MEEEGKGAQKLNERKEEAGGMISGVAGRLRNVV